MRQFWMATCVAASAFLVGCAAYQTEATPPTVSYKYAATADYAEVARKADNHCVGNYSKNAHLVDRVRGSGGYQATFSCQ